MQAVQPMLASPLKWVGGKSTMRRFLIDLLPADVECYAEVFAGAGWVLFGKPPHPVEVLNDANGDLVNLWRVLKWRPAELLERVQQYLYSREMFLELREQRPDGADEMERAVWLYLLIQMSFAGDVSRPQSAGFGVRKKGRGGFFLAQSLHQIEPAFERLRKVFVEHMDCVDLIKRYDEPRTVFFCDPPYIDTRGYAPGFGEDDHRRLAATLRDIEGRFLLTVNDHPLARELYAGFNIHERAEARSKARATEGRQPASCLVIANYPVNFDRAGVN